MAGRAHSTSGASGPGFPGSCGRQTRKQQSLSKDPANCREMKSVKFAGNPLAQGGEMLQDRELRTWEAQRARNTGGTREAHGSREEDVPEVRGLLLQAEHVVRSEARRTVPHLPPRGP